jgi:hypothetical protein
VGRLVFVESSFDLVDDCHGESMFRYVWYVKSSVGMARHVNYRSLQLLHRGA